MNVAPEWFLGLITAVWVFTQLADRLTGKKGENGNGFTRQELREEMHRLIDEVLEEVRGIGKNLQDLQVHVRVIKDRIDKRHDGR